MRLFSILLCCTLLLQCHPMQLLLWLLNRRHFCIFWTCNYLSIVKLNINLDIVIFTGKYWLGTRKIFAIITASSSNTPSAKSGVQCLISKQLFDESLTPITSKLESLDRKMEKMQVFLLKGCETVYKDISLFSREIFKCPICFGTTKDEIPHATSCCNPASA